MDPSENPDPDDIFQIYPDPRLEEKNPDPTKMAGSATLMYMSFTRSDEVKQLLICRLHSLIVDITKKSRLFVETNLETWCLYFVVV